MKKILSLLVIILAIAYPAAADTNQKADLDGGNALVVRVDQGAVNQGTGDINQNIGVHASGNIQKLDEDSILHLTDDTDMNYSLEGRNLILIDLNQFGTNMASGNIAQDIDILVDDSIQKIDQDIIVDIVPIIFEEDGLVEVIPMIFEDVSSEENVTILSE